MSWEHKNCSNTFRKRKKGYSVIIIFCQTTLHEVVLRLSWWLKRIANMIWRGKANICIHILYSTYEEGQSVQLDQVFHAWLIRWFVKRVKIQLAQLCVMIWWIMKWYHQLLLVDTWSAWVGTWGYRVSKGLLCLYILDVGVEIWSGVTDTRQTDRLTDNKLYSYSACLNFKAQAESRI